MPRNPAALFCFASQDDRLGGGKINKIFDCLAGEICSKGMWDFFIYRNGEGVAGQETWEERLSLGGGDNTFLFPVFTASFFRDEYCSRELDGFYNIISRVGNLSFIRPIYYNECDELEMLPQYGGNSLAMTLRQAGLVSDWRHLRHAAITDEKFGQEIENFARDIKKTLDGVVHGLPMDTAPTVNKVTARAGNEAYNRRFSHYPVQQPPRPVYPPADVSSAPIQVAGAPTPLVGAERAHPPRPPLQCHHLQLEAEIIERSTDKILRDETSGHGRSSDSPAQNPKLRSPRNMIGQIIVSKDGKGNFDNIGMALSHAAEGATILVRKGIYREVLKVYGNIRNVTIRGDGNLGDVVLQSNSETVLFISGGEDVRSQPIIYLENIVIEGGGASRRGVPALALGNGACVMIRCVIRGGKYCVRAEVGAILEIDDCRLYDAYAACVYAGASSIVKIKKSKIAKAHKYGVEVRKNAKILVECCDIFDCQSSGVCITFDARGDFFENNVYSNIHSGFIVFRGSTPNLKNNFIYGNDLYGVEVQFDSGGSYENNKISKNGKGSRNIKSLAKASFVWKGNMEK